MIAVAVFCLSGMNGKFFVELARLIVLFHVGLACAAFCWSYTFGVSCPVGLLPFCFFERRQGKHGVEMSSRG